MHDWNSRFRATYEVCVKFQVTSQWLALNHNNNKKQSMPVSAQGSLISKEGLTASLKDIWDTQKVPDSALTFATVNSETNTILRQCILKKNLDLDLFKNTHESYIFAVLVDFVLYSRMMVSYNPIFFDP